MVNIRAFEEEVARHSKQKLLHGTTHLYIGQEAVATGVCAALQPADYITSTHRGHGHAIAKGACLNKMMAEMFGKETGYCKGLGGSMHLADVTIGHLGSNGVVGANIPIAVGAALTLQMKKQNNVAVCFFGDGATNEGAFHEAMNMATIWRLPVIFVCENNLYGMSSAIDKMSAATELTDLGERWGVPSIVVDGNDVEAVYDEAVKAMDHARAGNGPTFIEAKTYRIAGHSRSDKELYRSKGEVEAWKKRDPFKQLERRLIKENNVDPAILNEIWESANDRIKAATMYAIESKTLAPEALEQFLFRTKEGVSK